MCMHIQRERERELKNLWGISEDKMLVPVSIPFSETLSYSMGNLVGILTLPCMVPCSSNALWHQALLYTNFTFCLVSEILISIIHHPPQYPDHEIILTNTNQGNLKESIYVYHNTHSHETILTNTSQGKSRNPFAPITIPIA